MTNAPTVVVVDPFSTGAELAPEFARRGWHTIAVVNAELPDWMRAEPLMADDYVTVLTYSDNLAATVDLLRQHDVRAVLAGTETGVAVADAINRELNLPGNSTALSDARRDKYRMVQALARAGVPAARSFLATGEDEAVRWARENADLDEIVVKPVNSAGSDSVTFCHSVAEVAKEFRRMHGTTNAMGSRNDAVLLQERLHGQQYVANSVSSNGTHSVMEIWEDHRCLVPGAGTVYDREILLPSEGEVQDQIRKYVNQVLDALEIMHGPGHAEIMFTAEGPKLIEIGARLQGAILPHAVEAAVGRSHVTVTVDAVTDPQRFAGFASAPYTLPKGCQAVALIASKDGRVADQPVVDELLALPSVWGVHGLHGEFRAGMPVRRTVDLFSTPAALYLVAGDMVQLERDYARIRELEATTLYV